MILYYNNIILNFNIIFLSKIKQQKPEWKNTKEITVKKRLFERMCSTLIKERVPS